MTINLIDGKLVVTAEWDFLFPNGRTLCGSPFNRRGHLRSRATRQLAGAFFRHRVPNFRVLTNFLSSHDSFYRPPQSVVQIKCKLALKIKQIFIVARVRIFQVIYTYSPYFFFRPPWTPTLLHHLSLLYLSIVKFYIRRCCIA